MTVKTISPSGSPLRRRMIEDMTIRGFTPSTQRGYIRAVKDFTAFLSHSPDRAGAEDLRRYQLHMRSGGGLGDFHERRGVGLWWCRAVRPPVAGLGDALITHHGAGVERA